MTEIQNDREALLTRAFVDLADTLVDDYDVIDVLDRLVAHSVTLLAAHAAGILLVDPRGQLRVVASSSRSPTGPSSCRSRPTRARACTAFAPGSR